jgi:hypothetical protein
MCKMKSASIIFHFLKLQNLQGEMNLGTLPMFIYTDQTFRLTL